MVSPTTENDEECETLAEIPQNHNSRMMDVKIVTNKNNENKEKIKTNINSDDLSERAALMQIAMAVVANITILSSGMGIGFPAITLPSLTRETDSMALTEDEFSWFASITSITCPLGGLFSSYSLEKFGRKKTLILINLISMVSWAILASSSSTDKDRMFIELLVARVIIGFAIGLSSSPASVYSAEISHRNLRGRLTILTSFATALGMLVIYTIGYLIPNNFRLLSIICGILTFISLLSLIPLPESPTWLIGRNRLTEAEHTLRIVRGVKKGEPTTSEITTEINALIQNLSKSQSLETKETMVHILKRPEVHKPLAIMIVFFIFQQFSGCFVIIVYGAKFAKEVGVSIDPLLCTVFIGVTRVCTTVGMAFISDKWGRKPSGLISGLGMSAAMFGMAACIWNPQQSTGLHWVPGALLISFIFFATLGFLTLPFAMIAEVFPQKFRGFGAGLTIFVAYIMAFIMIKLYPTMLATMGNGYLFVFYGIVAFSGVFFVYGILPETKGKTLQEIEDHFRGEIKEPADIEMQEKMIK